MKVRAIARLGLGALCVLVLSCAPSPAALCRAWAAGEGCVLPPLVSLAVPAAPEPPTRLVLEIDARGALVGAIASAGEGVERVTVFEERDTALVPRAWPGALDATLDMPALATGPDGGVALALRAGADGTTGDVLLATRDAHGAWSEPTRDAIVSFAPRAYEPRVAFDAAGGLLVVVNQWSAARMGYGVGVSGASAAGAPLARPTSADDVVSPPTFFSNSPRPALSPRGDVITWYQSLGGVLRVLFAERAAGASAFTAADPAQALSLDGTPVDSAAPPDPAAGADGTIAVAWGQEDGRGGVAVYVAIRAPGAAFERPRSLDERLSLGDGAARDVDAAVADDGTVLVAWSERGGGHEHVYLARIAPGASRGDAEVRVVSDLTLDADSPALAVSPRGELAIAWIERSDTALPRVVLCRGAVDGTLAPSEIVAAEAGAALPTVVFGRASRRFALGWITPAGARVVASP